MTELITIALVILTLLYIGYPVVRKSGRQMSFEKNHQVDDLQARKEEIYAAIRDIDFDFRMGKLSKEDYDELRQQYKGEAIEIMKNLDNVTIASSKSQPGQASVSNKFCHQCGKAVSAQEKFCNQCGESLA